jgi:hypothetical protein
MIIAFENGRRLCDWQKKLVARDPGQSRDYLGSVWFVTNRHTVRIENIVAVEKRRGVATALLRELQARYPGRPITTNAGTKSGRAWLRARGFAWNEKKGCWICE